MRWQLYTLFRAAMAPIPHSLRRRLQDVGGRSRLDIGTDYPRKLSFVRRMREQGLPVEGRTFLEIGTGWHPVLPVLLSMLGARRVIGSDLNPWLNRRSLGETLDAMHGIADRIADDLGLAPGDCREQLGRWRALAADPAVPLDEVLDAARLEYRAPLDAQKTDFADHQFDYMVSSNVLEHVPPCVIRGIIDESLRILAPDGQHLHHVNPGDHFSIVDPAISSVHFLRFSARAWRFIGGWGAGYHNRLRCADYGRMFQEQGFDVTCDEAEVDPRALSDLRQGRVRPHESYAGYTHEELAAHVVDVFARPRAAVGAAATATAAAPAAVVVARAEPVEATVGV
ncbi:MAG TPA: class I SAM-dependent methyltransferase [Longimicrobium sp.]|nr:class I SAM-dependent methyltransferase [Longimicrobium sp.]